MSGFSSLTPTSSSTSSSSAAKCNSCKAVFTSLEVVKEHYKSDWHVFNSKRRANGLAPLGLPDFKKICPQLKKSRRAISSAKLPTQPPPPAETTAAAAVKSTNSIKSSLPSPTMTKTTPTSTISEEYKHLALKLGVQEDRIESVLKLAMEKNLTNGEDEDDLYDVGTYAQEEEHQDDQEERKEEETKELDMPKIAPNISIFDDKNLDTTEECILYMERTFGFFIPDREYIIDLDGFLNYLGEKVKLGGYCLYCQKIFQPGRPCQNHMMNKSHCKIAYEEGIDLDEYEVLDFSLNLFLLRLLLFLLPVLLLLLLLLRLLLLLLLLLLFLSSSSSSSSFSSSFSSFHNYCSFMNFYFSIGFLRFYCYL